MPSPLKKAWRTLRSCVPAGNDESVHEDIQLRRDPTSTPAIKALELELAKERTKCARLEQEQQKDKTDADAKGKLEDEIREVKGFLEARQKEVGEKDARIQLLERNASEMQAKLAESRSAAARARELSTRLDEKDKLLSERTAELNAAQAFLTKVDAVSEAEVVGMVENLNTLISSASGALSDTWDEREPVVETLVEDPDLKQVRDYLGDLMFEQIAARNPVAVTLAIEMCLVRFVEQVTSGWGGGNAAGTLGEIYGMIFTKEGQAIASKWRTLTKRYKPNNEPPRSEEITGALARILMVTRSFSDFAEAMVAVGSSAGTEVEGIIEGTIQLDDTIKTKITSSDMYVYVVLPGTPFTEGTMANEFAEDGKKVEGGVPGVVAGTMEIGLLQRTGNVEKVLRKPKVILERDLPDPEE